MTSSHSINKGILSNSSTILAPNECILFLDLFFFNLSFEYCFNLECPVHNKISLVVLYVADLSHTTPLVFTWEHKSSQDILIIPQSSIF